MDLSALKSKIKSKQIPSFLIFTGTELEVQKIYINQIAKVAGLEVVRIESIVDIYSNLKSRSFLSKSYCYVARDDTELVKTVKLQDQIDNGLLGNNIFILLLSSVDKRTLFYKRYKDSIVEFEALSDELLKKYILREIKLSDASCQKLIQCCEHNYGRIRLEIDKIERFGAVTVTEVGNDSVYDADKAFRILLEDGTIHQSFDGTVFDFIEAVLQRKPQRAIRLLRQCKESGESTLAMLTLLYNNARSVLQVQSCESSDIAKTTGLNGWQIKLAKQNQGHYTVEELVSMLKLILDVEQKILSGSIEDFIAMDYILVTVL